MSRRPDLFIIGAAKCGTTSVYEWLRGHPEVYMSPAKEPRYFAPDIGAGNPHNLVYGRDLERYLGLFAAATMEKRLGEASVTYIRSRQAPRLIREWAAQPYIVVMVRDPIAAAYSAHNQRISEGREQATDFEQAIAAYPYLERVHYGQQLGVWLDTFSRERIHVIVFEDMVADPAGEFRRLLEFLEVDPNWQPATFAAYNTAHGARSRLLRRVTKSGAARWLVWRAVPRIAGDRLTRSAVRAFRQSPLNRRQSAKTPMPPELRDRLRDELAPDVARLSQLLKRDMAALWWADAGQSAPHSRAAAEVGPAGRRG